MFSKVGSIALVAASAVGLATAQYPPTIEGNTVVNSQTHPGVTISYKENEICETTPGVKSYSGYIHLPAGTLADTGTSQPYNINTFFWCKSYKFCQTLRVCAKEILSF